MRTAFPEFDVTKGVSRVYGDVGEALHLFRALEQEVEALARLHNEVTSIKAQIDRLQGEETATFPWLPSESAVSWVRQTQAAAEEVARQWRYFEGLLKKWNALKARRTLEFGVFEEAAPTLLERLDSYGATRRELQQRLAAAKARQQEALARRARIEAEYDDVRRWYPVLDGIEALIDVHTERAHLREEMRRHERAARRWSWTALALGTFGVAGIVGSLWLRAYATVGLFLIPLLGSFAVGLESRGKTGPGRKDQRRGT